MRWSDPPSSLSGTYDRVNLTVDAGDPATARAWKRAFDEVRQRAIEESVEPSWLSTGQSGNTATLTVQPEKKVFLTVYPANYTVSIYNAASLME